MNSFLIEPGQQIGELRIERELGRGAFGTVFLARDSLLRRLVALKVVRTPSGELGEEQREQALKEARLVAGLQSPQIVTLHRVHPLPEGTGWMFEMEYVEGGSLQTLFKEQGTLPADRGLPIVCEMVRGLKVAHDHDIVHGDIKPANVLLGKDGAVKLADFGLARFIGDHSLSVSDAGQPVGTPSYMAPEVIMGEAPRIASDIWSVGVLVYRILAGELPFHEDHLLSLFLSIQNAVPPLLDPATPPELAELAFRCLTKEPSLRPASCDEILDILQRPQAAPASVVRDRTPRPKPKRAVPKLFGRQKERATLKSTLLDREEDRGAAILISGDSGVGKSTLIQSVLADEDLADWVWIQVSAATGQGLLRPLVESVRRDVTEKETLLHRSRFDASTPLLRELIGGSGPPPAEDRQQLAWAVEELLCGLASDRPVGVLIEDAQLVGEEDYEVLTGMARRLPTGGVSLIVEYWTHDPSRSSTTAGGLMKFHDLASVDGVRHINLEPLAPEALYRVLEQCADGLKIDPEIVERVVRLAEGNAFFARELLQHMEDTQATLRAPPELRLGPNWSKAKLPQGLTDLVGRRLHDLPAEDRGLLEAASVDGTAFDGESVAAVAERPLLTVLRSLQRLFRETGLLVAREDGFRFANALLRGVLYEGLAPELRRAIHRRLAEHLEARPPEKPIDPERLGTHWLGAGDVERARPHLLTAALQSTKRQEYVHAINLVKKAGLDPTRVDAKTAQEQSDLFFALAGCNIDLGRRDRAETICNRLLAAADELDDETLRLRAIVWLNDSRYWAKGAESTDQEQLEHAAAALPEGEDLCRAQYLLGVCAKFRGELDSAAEWLGKADRLATKLEILSLHSSALNELASVELRRGNNKEAESLYKDAARISAHLGRRTNAAISEVNGALAAFGRGALDGLVAALEASIRTLALEGARGYAAHATLHLALVHYANGDRGGAVTMIREALDALEREGSVPGQDFGCVELAYLLAVGGEVAEAFAVLKRARELAEQSTDQELLIKIAGIEVHLKCCLGDLAGAVEALREGTALLEQALEMQVGAEFGLRVAEAALYGLPESHVESVRTLLAGAKNETPLHEIAAAALGAARAPDDKAALKHAAQIIKNPTTGLRLAERGILAQWFEARARGDDDRVAADGLEKARRLEHVWLEAAFLRSMARHEELAELVERVASKLSSAAEQNALSAAWRI